MKGFGGHIRTPRRARRPAGYTLVELLIAMGILGIGLGLIATAFPSAMLENKASVHDTMSTIIAENAAAICRTRLSHSQLVGLPLTHEFRDISDLIHDLIHPAERAYPTPVGKPTAQGPHVLQIGSSWYRPEDWFEDPNNPGDYYPSSRYGWLVAARRVLPGWRQTDPLPDPLPNDYQLVIVPYRKFNPTDRPGQQPGHEIRFADIAISGGGTTPTSAAFEVDVGAPVILKATFKGNGELNTAVEFAYINPDGKLSTTLVDADPALTVEYSLGNESPVIGCYIVRTALRP